MTTKCMDNTRQTQGEIVFKFLRVIKRFVENKAVLEKKKKKISTWKKLVMFAVFEIVLVKSADLNRSKSLLLWC